LIILSETFFCSPGLTPAMLFRVTGLIVLLTVAFLTGCETTKKDQADAHSIISEPDKGSETHGEVRAMYGASAGH